MVIYGSFTLSKLFEFISIHFQLIGALYISMREYFRGVFSERGFSTKKWNYLAIFRKILIKLMHKKGDKGDCGNYRGISRVSVGSKLLSNIILFRLKDLFRLCRLSGVKAVFQNLRDVVKSF